MSIKQTEHEKNSISFLRKRLVEWRLYALYLLILNVVQLILGWVK